MLGNQEKLIAGAGPSSLGHAIPNPSLTLADSRLSLSLLRMCTKRSWAQRIDFRKQLDACAEPGSLKPFFFKSLYLNNTCFTANLCLGVRRRQRSVTRPAISKREAGRVRQVRRLGRGRALERTPGQRRPAQRLPRPRLSSTQFG